MKYVIPPPTHEYIRKAIAQTRSDGVARVVYYSAGMRGVFISLESSTLWHGRVVVAEIEMDGDAVRVRRGFTEERVMELEQRNNGVMV